jgi:5'-nucleotidase / UDP-sugar diphosphatase
MTKPHVKALVLNVLFLVMCLLAPNSVAADWANSSNLRFTILHTNDLHAHDEPFVDRGRTVGGMARIAHIMQAIKAKNPHVLTIDAGDIFQGTSFFKFYHGQVEVEMLNAAGYDIYTIGNHEFDDGSKNLAQQLKNARFDIINSNLDAAAVPELAALIKPHVVKTIAGQRVAFIGAVVPNLNEVSLKTEGVKVKATGDEWMEPVKREIDQVKSQGIDKIVLVTHCGLELDKQLATISDVDVIVGGHSHTRLDTPVIVDHKDGSKCIIVQTGSYGRTLGKLDLAFRADGQLVLPNTRYRLINITDKIHEDPKIKAYLEEKAQPFAKMRATVVGTATGNFDNAFRKYPWDSSLGNLVTDALVDGAASYGGATIAFQNRGGIRGRIDQGPITEEKIDEVLPFENHLVAATVPGETILKTLEHSLSGENVGGKFLDVHGIKFAYDRYKPSNHRVLWVLAQDKNGSWKPLDLQAKYRIAVNDYTFNGGEGYDFSAATEVNDSKQRLAKFFRDYLARQKTVSPQTPNRIVPVASDLAAVDVKTDSHQPQMVIKAHTPGARVLIVRGTGRGVSLIKGTKYPVPLQNAKLIRSTTLGRGEKEVHVTLPQDKSSQAQYAAILLPKGQSQPPQVSSPLDLP